MLIIGAGLAGLLAANLLRYKNPVVIEKQDTLPNNHSAVLRFRSSIISDVTGIPFRKVQVVKMTLPWLNPVADALAYAEKNTAELRSDRSMPIQFTNVERYIAPPDLINQLAVSVDIQYGMDGPSDPNVRDYPIISTIPMPALMTILGYPKRPTDFPSVSGCNIRAKVSHCDAYASLYVPSPIYPFSRISIMGNEIIAEVPYASEVMDETIFIAAGLLGIERHRISNIESRKQTYSKILPIDDRERKTFIAWATDEHNVYSLGRYACWRPGLLLDDLVQDIRLIERWISGGSYAIKQHR